MGVTRENRQAELRRQISLLTAELEELERPQARSGDPSGAPENRHRWGPTGKGKPLRSLVLDALDALGTPALSREIQAYLFAVYGFDVEPTRFGSLRREEMRAFDNRIKRPRTHFIAYGLTERGEAIKRLLCRSDWPLEERVVAPTTGRVQHLRMTLRLCEIALNDRERVAHPDALNLLVADHARDLPGSKFSRDDFPLETWRRLAAELLGECEERDRANRIAIAQRLNLFSDDKRLLFGAEPEAADTRIEPPITEEAFGA